MKDRLRTEFVVLALLLQCSSVKAASNFQQSVRTQLSGVWVGFAVEGKGENPDRGPVNVELTITPEVIQGRELRGDKVIDHGEGSYQIDPAVIPPLLDATRNGARRESWLGIFSLEGDTLKWCVGRRQRPSEFETKKGAFLLILKRQKP